MAVMDYVARFTELARFANDYVVIDMAKVRRFENGLKLSIRARIVMLRALGMRVLVARGGRVSLLPVQERGRELLVHEGSRVMAIRAKDR